MVTSKTTATPKVSKAQAKLLETVKKYEALRKERDLTQRELVLLANAKSKLEDKSLSRIYKMITDPSSPIAEEVKMILGDVRPTFKTLQANIGKPRAWYSTYHALCALARMNPSAKLAKKLIEQGGKVEK